MTICDHKIVNCLNHFELIRKYRCDQCGEIMMCKCDEEIGKKYLKHQIEFTTDNITKKQIKVTLGFQNNICNKCRGLPEEPHPKSESFGTTTKIKRYYWREISLETIKRFGEWSEQNGFPEWLKIKNKYKDVLDKFEKDVIEEIKTKHNLNPTYEYQVEISEKEILKSYNIETIEIKARTIKDVDGIRKYIGDNGKLNSSEEFAIDFFKKAGYEVLFTESRPFHALFGIFMWILIQDSSDPAKMIISFGNREDFEKGIKGKLITTILPIDFGSIEYGKRRKEEIEKHINSLPRIKVKLLWNFDYWIEPSKELREYLWAHKQEDIEKARLIIEILPVDRIIKILNVLIENYWGRYCGWPDLLVYDNEEYFFAEVKGIKDKLREDQKKWIGLNNSEYKLPYKFIKIVE